MAKITHSRLNLVSPLSHTFHRSFAIHRKIMSSSTHSSDFFILLTPIPHFTLNKHSSTSLLSYICLTKPYVVQPLNKSIHTYIYKCSAPLHKIDENKMYTISVHQLIVFIIKKKKKKDLGEGGGGGGVQGVMSYFVYSPYFFRKKGRSHL